MPVVLQSIQVPFSLISNGNPKDSQAWAHASIKLPFDLFSQGNPPEFNAVAVLQGFRVEYQPDPHGTQTEFDLAYMLVHVGEVVAPTAEGNSVQAGATFFVPVFIQLCNMSGFQQQYTGAAQILIIVDTG
jgi:hypothetical protein